MKDYIWDIHQVEDEVMLNHMIYTFMTHWDNLMSELKRTQLKFKLLVISNNDIRHALMLKNILELEFTDQLDITVGTEFKTFTDADINKDFDVIVSNFPIDDKYHPHIVCVENLPTEHDMLVIMENLRAVNNKD